MREETSIMKEFNHVSRAIRNVDLLSPSVFATELTKVIAWENRECHVSKVLIEDDKAVVCYFPLGKKGPYPYKWTVSKDDEKIWVEHGGITYKGYSGLCRLSVVLDREETEHMLDRL